MSKSYVVANPRGIPAGIPILAVRRAGEEKQWYEGDTIAPADAFSPEGWRDLLAQGLVREVT